MNVHMTEALLVREARLTDFCFRIASLCMENGCCLVLASGMPNGTAGWTCKKPPDSKFDVLAVVQSLKPKLPECQRQDAIKRYAEGEILARDRQELRRRCQHD